MPASSALASFPPAQSERRSCSVAMVVTVAWPCTLNSHLRVRGQRRRIILLHLRFTVNVFICILFCPVISHRKTEKTHISQFALPNSSPQKPPLYACHGTYLMYPFSNQALRIGGLLTINPRQTCQEWVGLTSQQQTETTFSLNCRQSCEK